MKLPLHQLGYGIYDADQVLIATIETRLDDGAALVAAANDCRWIPVGESLPPSSDDVQILSDEHSQEIGFLDGHQWRGPFCYPRNVTHWRPLIS